MNIFHIVSVDDWTAAEAAGSYAADSLAAEGFIHFSYARQVGATANRYYAGRSGLQVIEVDPTQVGVEIRVEPSPATGELFPHLYGELPTSAVVQIHQLDRDGSGGYVF